MNGQQVRRRSFGNVRRVSKDGYPERYQARYTAPDHTLVNVKGSFPTRREAERALVRIQAEMLERRWSDPRTKRPTFEQYAPLALARSLKPKTRQTYEGLLRLHLLPVFGKLTLDQIDVGMVNRWHGGLTGSTTAKRQRYALLKEILGQAVEEEIIDRNPCRIKGAGQNRYAPRPYLRPEYADLILDHLTGDLWVLGQLAYDTHLRVGEALALTWSDIDFEEQVIHVRRAVSEVANEQIVVTPKNGEERSVAFEYEIADMLRTHRNSRTPQQSTGRVFLRKDGSALRHFHVSTAWNKARKEAGLTQFRFHDLRHSGLTQAATQGLSLKSVMARGGHKTTAAALNYQHLSAEQMRRDSRKLADAKAKRRRSHGTPMALPEKIGGDNSQNMGAA